MPICVDLDSHRITGEPRGWKLERKTDPSKAPSHKKKEGAEGSWGNPTYPSNLDSVFRYILEERIKDRDAETLEQLRDVIDEERERLHRETEPLFATEAFIPEAYRAKRMTLPGPKA